MAKEWHIESKGFPTRERMAILEGGYAVPLAFPVVATSGDLHVEIDVEVVDGRAWVRRASVATEAPRGVTSTTLRDLPLRDLVGQGLRLRLMRIEATDVEVTDDQTAVEISPIAEWTEEDVEVARRLVGYVEVRP